MAYTSALYCYPYPIEKIELGRLKSFTERFFELGLTKSEGSFYVELKFGKSPMQDAKPSFEVKAVNEYIGVTEDIDWDKSEYRVGDRASLVGLLEPEQESLYRAHIGLGSAPREISSVVTRFDEAKPDDYLALDSWSLRLGPIEISDDEAKTECVISVLGISFHGYGSVAPWTHQELLDRLHQIEDVRRLEELCRSIWPVNPSELRPESVELRKQLGAQWLYPLDHPYDWFWIVHD